MAHQYLVDQFGWWNNHSLPVWKLEGMCDYLSNIGEVTANPVANLESRLDLLLNDNYWGGHYGHSRTVLKGQLIVEFLIEIEGMSVARVMAAETTEAPSFKRLLQYFAN